MNRAIWAGRPWTRKRIAITAIFLAIALFEGDWGGPGACQCDFKPMTSTMIQLPTGVVS